MKRLRFQISNFRSPISSPRAAFTLTELLVVIGIIVVLVTLLIPVISRARMRGPNARASQADIQGIAAGLENYKTDFGNYPRVDLRQTGFGILAKCLMGPGGVGEPPMGVSGKVYNIGDVIKFDTYPQNVSKYYLCARDGSGLSGFETYDAGLGWLSGAYGALAFTDQDGADGHGFRLRPGGQGQVWGPYLSPSRYKTYGCSIRDFNDRPVLYYVRRGSNPNVANGDTWLGYGGWIGEKCLYDLADNPMTFFNQSTWNDTDPVTGRYIGQIRMGQLLGDSNYNGNLDPGEVVATTGSYLLWAAGPDKMFGGQGDIIDSKYIPTLQEVAKCDDVTNFRP